jgi:lipoprotein-releasing system permease protein
LNGWKHDQASGAELSVADFSQMDNIAAQVGKRIGKTTDQYGETYSYQTIRDSSPQIFSWLDLLDLNVWIILALMLAVATVTMISGLLIIILERTSMIGLMKALGAGNRIIRTTFLWLATLMVGKGMIIGNVVGIGLVLLQHYTGLVQLDSETYYVEQVPVEINVLFILLLNVATLIINVLALIAPTYLVSKIHPAKSMRYE